MRALHLVLDQDKNLVVRGAYARVDRRLLRISFQTIRDPRPVYVYVLTDERGIVRYIGSTINPRQRAMAHRGGRGGTATGQWARLLRDRGESMSMVILARFVCLYRGGRAEAQLIDQYASRTLNGSTVSAEDMLQRSA